MNNISVREMTIEDYEPVLELWNRTEGMGLTEADSKEGIEKFLARNKKMSPVAILDECIVGAALCGHDGRRGYLYHLAVDNEFRSRGIAKKMLEFIRQKLDENGIVKCNILIFDHNESGKKFWIHNGWDPKDWKTLQKDLRELPSNI